jgi:hypothetical protein
MQIIISEFISLAGVVQAPGGPDEDADRGFQHGGWSMPFFDPEVMGRASTRSPNGPTRFYRTDRRASIRAAHVAGHSRRVARTGR